MRSQFDPHNGQASYDHDPDPDSSGNDASPVGMALDNKRQHSDKVRLEWTNRDEHLLTGSYKQQNVFVLTTGGREAPEATFKLKVTNDTGQMIEGTLFVQLRKVVKQLPEKDGKREEVTRVILLKGQKDSQQWYKVGDYPLGPARHLEKDILIHLETLKKAYQEGDTQIAFLTFLFQWRPLHVGMGVPIPGTPYFNQRTARFILVNPLEFKGKISPPDGQLVRLDPNEERKYRIKILPPLEHKDSPIKTEYKITESWTTTQEKEQETSKREGETKENKRSYSVGLEAADFLKTGLKLSLGASWEKTVSVTTEVVETFRSKLSTEFGTSIEKPVRIEVPPPQQGYLRNAFLYPLFERFYIEAIFFKGPSRDGYAEERKGIEKFPMLRLVNWKVGWEDYPKAQKKTSAAHALGNGTSAWPSTNRTLTPNRLPVVVIDPGHGGSQRIGGSSPNNAIGPNGLLEKNLTLDLARRLQALLSPVADVVLTRDRDLNLALADRARAARDRHADLFLSIHLNGFSNAQIDGTETWIARQANQQSRAFAKTVLRHLPAVTGVKNRGVKERDLGVLLPDRHAPRTAATLLEVAFLTNPTQARRLTEENYKQQLAEAIAAGVSEQIRAGVATEQSANGVYSRPLYDTGEHVQTGGDLYPEQLRLGKNPGVRFSYGQIIAMADLYESVDQMMGADVKELQRIKSLIERSTKYYETNKTDKNLDVTHKEWDDATDDRYLKLAEDNYEHFSPNLLFKDAVFAKGANKYGNNKSAWERHHQRAIEEAQKMFIAPENRNRTPFLEWPLIINAFGDHFLTDAFAAGHVVNKEALIEYFKFKFFKGKSLKPEGEEFFARVARLAFKGNVAKKFSALETTDYPVCARGWCIMWHPNIDTVNAFRKMLLEIAEQRPDAVANLAAKALHDRLNKDGIEVFNAAGDRPWKLFGDEYLDSTTLRIIQKAVQQSVDNLNDRSILASNLNFGTYFSKVWKYVPQLTEASQKQVKRLAQDYTDPASEVLAKAAAEIIYKQVDSLIKRLIKEKKLKPA